MSEDLQAELELNSQVTVAKIATQKEVFLWDGDPIKTIIWTRQANLRNRLPKFRQ